jgi:hypothetical protein
MAQMFWVSVCVCLLYARIQIVRTCKDERQSVYVPLFDSQPNYLRGIELSAYNLLSHQSCHAPHLYHICKVLPRFKSN